MSTIGAQESIRNALAEMGLPESDCLFITDLDALADGSAILSSLDSKIADSMVITGPWRDLEGRGVDVYDLVLRFVENSFSKARVTKKPEWYAVIATNRLK